MIVQLTNKIWVVSGKKQGRYPYSHSLYICDGGGILVDCGSDLDEIVRLKNEQGLAAILMTHYHEDHLLFLYSFPDVDLWASEEDAAGLESLEVVMQWYGMDDTPWKTRFRKILTKKFNYVPRKVDRRIVDGQDLQVGSTPVKAIVAPGHTQGHLCLLFPKDGILFMGDYDLTAFGPWYGGRKASIEKFRNSGKMLGDLGADIHVVSHEEAIHQGDIRKKMDAYLSVIDRREDMLRDFLRVPRTQDEIIARRIIYEPNCKGPWFDYGEWALMGKHLEEMMARGEARFENNRYSLVC
jgi:glyoxylase-like metal-dependent hydrolase (beta-lactamase superfamily II)